MDPSNLCIRIATVDYDGEAALKRFQEDRNRGKSYAEEFVNSVAPRVVQACDQFERFMENLSGKG
jgi:hypothetical protein